LRKSKRNEENQEKKEKPMRGDAPKNMSHANYHSSAWRMKYHA
jgi:hypothetical protein